LGFIQDYVTHFNALKLNLGVRVQILYAFGKVGLDALLGSKKKGIVYPDLL